CAAGATRRTSPAWRSTWPPTPAVSTPATASSSTAATPSIEEAQMADRYARYERLKFERPAPGVLRIVMSNPGKLNAADATMHRELAEIWRDVDADPDVRCAILTGEGTAFSAGGDFEMIQGIVDDFEVRTRSMREARDIVMNIIDCQTPVISAMRGVAVGAGLVCGLLADVSIATPDCRIIDGHTRLGVAAGDHA